MKIQIDYHSIGHGAQFFASPEFTNTIIVEAESLEDPKLIAFIESQQDHYDNNFELSPTKFMGFDYISHQGGVKVKEYIEPKVYQI